MSQFVDSHLAVIAVALLIVATAILTSMIVWAVINHARMEKRFYRQHNEFGRSVIWFGGGNWWRLNPDGSVEQISKPVMEGDK